MACNDCQLNDKVIKFTFRDKDNVQCILTLSKEMLFKDRDENFIAIGKQIEQECEGK